eukprot:snap_masked-scaffold_24-processed-gene-2.24-mRNA-1 protein AED:0.01 eAED:0.01 QI:0/-1/0/1/-1/1/1/0/761
MLRKVITTLLFVCSAFLVNGVEEEKFEFQAEVSRMMDIIINSLYQRKEVFLREVISNSADALDKIRFLSLQDSEELGVGDERNLEIKISFDEEAKTLTLRDTGIGFTREDLIQNLGTVAKSGTSNFMEQLASAEGGDLSLIGQFGVGFYSVYLVSDRVTVKTKHNKDKQYIWESTADNTFTIKEDEGEPMGRGTELTLHLKEDALEYLDQDRLEQLIRRYSEFVGFPIYLYKKEVTYADEDEDEDEYDDDEDDYDEDEDLEDDEEMDDDEDEDEEPEEIITWEWVRVNDQPALWTRSAQDIDDEEYADFYKAIAGEEEDPISWTHFKAEGEVEFKSILYIPHKAPSRFYDNYHEKRADLKLYVRKVLIKDDFEDLLPTYLNFIKGVVDSDDLPLSVSRETIQQVKAVGVISKKLTRKALDMLSRLAKDETREKEDEFDDEEDVDDVKKVNYTGFYEQFGRSIKLGVLEDNDNKNKLLKLLRFKTTKKDEHGNYMLTSFDDYVERMPEWQSEIYFLTGESTESIVNTPFLKRAVAKGAEVVLFDEPIDEYVVQSVPDFDGHKLQSLAKEGLKFGDEDEELGKAEKYYKKEFKELGKWLKNLYTSPDEGGKWNKVDKVQFTLTKIDESLPGLIIASSYGHGANMERIMKSQTLGDREMSSYMTAKKILELNPRNPIVDRLKILVDTENFDEAKNIAWVMYDSILLQSGFDLDDSVKYAERTYELLRSNLNLDSLDPLPVMDIPEEEDEELEEDIEMAGEKMEL